MLRYARCERCKNPSNSPSKLCEACRQQAQSQKCPHQQYIWSSSNRAFARPYNWCDKCQSQKAPMPMWVCTSCKFTACRDCKPPLKPDPRTLLRCFNHHLLQWEVNDKPDEYSCLLCARTQRESLGFWSCKTCSYKACPDCRPKPATCDHDKDVWVLLPSEQADTSESCDKCSKAIGHDYSRWGCINCNIQRCIYCKPVRVSQDGSSQTGQSIPSLLVYCRNQHSLSWTTDSKDYSRGLYACDICTSYGLTQKGRWACLACKYDVCSGCWPSPANFEFESQTGPGPGFGPGPRPCVHVYQPSRLPRAAPQCSTCHVLIPSEQEVFQCTKCTAFACINCKLH
jgi:hypothetical protein